MKNNIKKAYNYLFVSFFVEYDLNKNTNVASLIDLLIYY